MNQQHLDSTKTAFGILLLRIFIAFRLLYGVVDNVVSCEKMMEFSDFLEAFNFPFPTVSALISVYAQFLAAVAILLGYKIRLFSLLMVFNFLVALSFVHFPSGDTVEVMTPALLILAVCLTFSFTGAEKFSLDHYFAGKGNRERQNFRSNKAFPEKIS